MTTEQMTEFPWSAPVRLEEVPETGRHVELEASEAVRAAVARVAKVDGIERLTATFDMTRRGRDSLRAVGRVSATVRQTCVVSLEPLTSKIEEAIDVIFAPPPDAATANAGDEVELDAANDDAFEVLVNGTVDLGALATEFLILGIDPYPRKAGVAFEPPVKPDEAAAHPFAALAALKKPGKVKD